MALAELIALAAIINVCFGLAEIIRGPKPQVLRALMFGATALLLCYVASQI